ncbi:unnamed protein product [Mytilus coruscus]|uniref:Uncharacterized protein n=1 Tax=Mytilus coruscus TaxID=42192 RepID=A0A6J8ASC6_MYTCO|nr:unnamed protein product [Mytilus coruscus]
MCQGGSGKKEDSIEGLGFNSVALRITTRQDNCACQVYLQNQTDTYTVYMQKYNKLTSAAPNSSDCGLVINVSVSDGVGTDEILETVECANGTLFQPISLEINGTLNFKSTVIEGSFTRGYCLQIFRKNPNTSHPSLQIACTQVTSNKTNYSPVMKEDTSSTHYVVIGACAGGFVFVISIAVVVVSCIRKKQINDSRNDYNNTELNKMKSDNDAGYDSEGLKRNILYQTSEQCDITDGNYHPVELEERQVVNNMQNIDGDYISIDENFGTNRKNTPNPGIQPKCKTITKENLNKIDHVTTGTVNNVEYAVVNKRDRLGENIEHATAPSTEFAVVDKSGRLGKNIKHVTPENGSNVEYAVVEKNTQI